MKIENKDSLWSCGHKSTQRGNVARCWRDAHKKARGKWKSSVFKRDYDSLIKRI